MDVIKVYYKQTSKQASKPKTRFHISNHDQPLFKAIKENVDIINSNKIINTIKGTAYGHIQESGICGNDK